MNIQRLKSFTILKGHIGEILFSAVFGVVFSLAAHLINEDVLGLSVAQILFAFFACLILLYVIDIAMDKVTGKDNTPNVKYGLKMWAIIWAVGIIIDLICLLTYFPGVGMNDSLNILRYGMEFSNQFPVFYCAFVTLLARIGSQLGSLQISIALYSVIQVLAISAACAFIITWFFNKCAPKWMKYIVLVYLVAEPLLTMYSISMLKDSPFSVLLIVLTIIVYDLLLEKEDVIPKWEFCILAVTILGLLWLRNNGTYIVFPMLIILLIACSRYRKEMIQLIIVAIVAVLLSNVAMAHYGQEQSFTEMVGIPLQQMSAVVANDGNMTDDQKDFMNHLMPLDEIKKRYNPSTVDSIKWSEAWNFDKDFLESHKMEFLITWAQMLPSNLMIYIKAYLQQTFWFWAPYQQGTVQCCYSIETASNNEWLPDFMEENGIHDQPLFPETINNVLRSWFSVADKFFREGVCFWIILATLLLNIIKKKKIAFIGVYAPVILLWLTIMISTPVASSMRYVLAFVYGLPVFIGLLFVKPADQEIVANDTKSQGNECE